MKDQTDEAIELCAELGLEPTDRNIVRIWLALTEAYRDGYELRDAE